MAVPPTFVIRVVVKFVWVFDCGTGFAESDTERFGFETSTTTESDAGPSGPEQDTEYVFAPPEVRLSVD